jgi:hypothetical protein
VCFASTSLPRKACQGPKCARGPHARRSDTGARTLFKYRTRSDGGPPRAFWQNNHKPAYVFIPSVRWNEMGPALHGKQHAAGTLAVRRVWTCQSRSQRPGLVSCWAHPGRPHPGPDLETCGARDSSGCALGVVVSALLGVAGVARQCRLRW